MRPFDRYAQWEWQLQVLEHRKVMLYGWAQHNREGYRFPVCFANGTGSRDPVRPLPSRLAALRATKCDQLARPWWGRELEAKILGLLLSLGLPPLYCRLLIVHLRYLHLEQRLNHETDDHLGDSQFDLALELVPCRFHFGAYQKLLWQVYDQPFLPRKCSHCGDNDGRRKNGRMKLHHRLPLPPPSPPISVALTCPIILCNFYQEQHLLGALITSKWTRLGYSCDSRLSFAVMIEWPDESLLQLT